MVIAVMVFLCRFGLVGSGVFVHPLRVASIFAVNFVYFCCLHCYFTIFYLFHELVVNDEDVVISRRLCLSCMQSITYLYLCCQVFLSGT